MPDLDPIRLDHLRGYAERLRRQLAALNAQAAALRDEHGRIAAETPPAAQAPHAATAEPVPRPGAAAANAGAIPPNDAGRAPATPRTAAPRRRELARLAGEIGALRAEADALAARWRIAAQLVARCELALRQDSRSARAA